MDEPSSKPVSHLNRVFRLLTLVGSLSLVLGLVIQLSEYGSFGSRGQALNGYVPLVVAQLFLIIGPVALTGAVFALVLLAVSKDRDAEASTGGTRTDRDLFE